jgi:hypothetical protein
MAETRGTVKDSRISELPLKHFERLSFAIFATFFANFAVTGFSRYGPETPSMEKNWADNVRPEN